MTAEKIEQIKERSENGKMNELIKVDINENQEPVISGRELHEKLEKDTPFRIWFARMCEYGFSENIDYTPYIFIHPKNNQETIDYILKLDMAKEVCMIQRNEKGKQIRKYLIEVEKFHADRSIICLMLK